MAKLSDEDLQAWVGLFKLLAEIEASLPPEVYAEVELTENKQCSTRYRACF